MENDYSADLISEYQKELGTLINKHISSDGKHRTIIPEVQLLRASTVYGNLHSIYDPSLILIVQGSKIVMLGDEIYQYDSASYLVSSVHLPIVGRIINVEPEKPYLCIHISFHTDQIIDIVKDSDQMWSKKVNSGRGLVLNRTNVTLLDAVTRLVRLLDTPQDLRVLSPLIIREILYRILQEDQGHIIKQFFINGSHAHSIEKIIKLINDDFSKPLRIKELAGKANMSISSLHSQFKKVTAMTPLQYQKMIRLQEARSLLLNESLDAADAGFQVGYESPSQFNREYSRLFGLPPISDVRRLKNSPSLSL